MTEQTENCRKQLLFSGTCTGTTEARKDEVQSTDHCRGLLSPSGQACTLDWGLLLTDQTWLDLEQGRMQSLRTSLSTTTGSHVSDSSRHDSYTTVVTDGCSSKLPILLHGLGRTSEIVFNTTSADTEIIISLKRKKISEFTADVLKKEKNQKHTEG